jgi:hypothetical protein
MTSNPLEWLFKKTITNIVENVNKLEPSSYIADKNIKKYVHSENSLAVPEKVKHRINS